MKRPAYFWFATLLILLIGFFTGVFQLDGVSLWYDESVTRVVVQQANPLDASELLLNDPTHLPLYFAIMQPMHANNDFILRLPNVFVGILSIALIMRVAISFYGDYNLALWVGGLLAINPYNIWLIRAARPNALLLLVVLLATYAFIQLVRGKRSTLHWVLFIVFSMAAYITRYYAAALPLAQYFYFAFTLRGNRKFFWQWIGAQLIAMLPLLLWWYRLTLQDGVALGIGWIPKPELYNLLLTFWNMSVGYEGEVYVYEILGVLAAAIGCCVSLYTLLRHWKNNLVDFYWFLLAIPPLLLIFALSFIRPLYVDRYFVFALPSLLFFIVRGWQRLGKQGDGKFRVPTTALAGVFIVVCLLNFGVGLAKKEHEHQDWRGVVAYIENHRQPNDALLIGDELMLIPFMAYFDGDIPVVFLKEGELKEMPTPAPDYFWVVYQDGQAHVNRQGKFPGFSYATLPPDMRMWVDTRRENVTYERVYTGVMLIGVKFDE